MTTIMKRSFAETMGVEWPPEVAYVVGDSVYGERRAVTWDEVMEARRERQRERLEQIQRPDPPHAVPCYVWVFRVPGWLYGGWWCYVVTRYEEIAVNFPRIHRHHFGLALSIMRAAPCGFLPFLECFDDWMPAFAKKHPRPPTRDPREAGTLVGWMKDREEFVRI